MKFITTLLLFVSLSVFAQSKTGTVDIDYIVTQMPEFNDVQTAVDTYGKELDADLQAKLENYSTSIEAYKAEEASLTIAQKKTQQTTIIAAEEDIKKFRDNAFKLIEIKRDEVLRPLYKKIGTALETVAKAKSFTLIMQTNESMVYIDASTDVTRAVLTELGITIKE